jgi:type II secretory pathway component PulC
MSVPWRCEPADGERRYRLVSRPEDREQIRAHVRVVPYFERPGQLEGYKLYAIRRGHDSCGFRSGDVITHVNDTFLETPDVALLAYRQAAEQGVMRVAVIRNGERISVDIELPD